MAANLSLIKGYNPCNLCRKCQPFQSFYDFLTFCNNPFKPKLLSHTKKDLVVTDPNFGIPFTLNGSNDKHYIACHGKETYFSQARELEEINPDLTKILYVLQKHNLAMFGDKTQEDFGGYIIRLKQKEKFNAQWGEGMKIAQIQFPLRLIRDQIQFRHHFAMMIERLFETEMQQNFENAGMMVDK